MAGGRCLVRHAKVYILFVRDCGDQPGASEPAPVFVIELLDMSGPAYLCNTYGACDDNLLVCSELAR